MRQSRVYIDQPLQPEQRLPLDEENSHYLLTVLRLRVGDKLLVFNGQGGEYSAVLAEATKKRAVLQVEQHQAIERESAVTLHLLQGISRPEHMDLAVQKAVELGVASITPILTTRSPPLPKHHFAKRQRHWAKIIQRACEQCGRNRLPVLAEIQTLEKALSDGSQKEMLKLMLYPAGSQKFAGLPAQANPVSLLIGAEGGFDDAEYEMAARFEYIGVTLGSRILRTETATIAALTACQMRWGDF